VVEREKYVNAKFATEQISMCISAILSKPLVEVPLFKYCVTAAIKTSTSVYKPSRIFTSWSHITS